MELAVLGEEREGLGLAVLGLVLDSALVRDWVLALVWEPLAVQEVRLVEMEALGIVMVKPGLDWMLRGLESKIFWGLA